MKGRLNPASLVIAAALLVVSALTASSAAAQDASGRFRVLIPNFFPQQGADDDFGKDTAEKLREAMDRLATHQPIEKDELEDQLKRFNTKMEDLNCTTTRQLGAQINAQVALCASYTEVGNDQVRVDAEFWDLSSQSSFALEPFTIGEDDDEEAAQLILQQFDEYTQALRIRGICFTYASERAWDDALRTCEQALELNPDDLGLQKQRARVLFEMSKSGPEDDPTFDPAVLQQAYEAITGVVDKDPLDDEALQLAGYMASQLGMTEEGRAHYSQYLELNPGDVGVRRNIAYQIFEAGDPEGAMLFIEEGLGVEDNPDLLVDYGNYAFALAAQRASEAGEQDSGGISADVADLYTDAVEAYMQAFEEKGAEMSVAALKNVINAYTQLDQPEDAISVGERILEVHPDEASLWWAYAQALQRAERTDEAMEALGEVARIDPEYPDLYAIQGRWLLDQGRLDDAVAKLEEAVARGRNPDQMARLIFADAHAIGTQQKDLGRAIRYMETAKQFDVSDGQRQELDFWHAYFLLQKGRADEQPQTLETARATLPMFQQAKRLFEASRPHAQQNPNLQLGSLIQATDQYIAIQEAIIKRAGGR
ncbi:MAG: tetratricopeptide repeat protein [Gemmatimonadota bacterium]|jgi:tetratricopeptide (TPR) repeat protein